MASQSRRLMMGGLIVAVIAASMWIYNRSLVPAVHPDHDHGLQNIAGGGYLWVDAAEGGRRNLVGRPGHVLILHWFQLGSPPTASELPLLVDYMQSVGQDTDVEVVMIATETEAKVLFEWARKHGVPSGSLYADKQSKTAALMGVRGTPETLIYDPEGQLVHQARGSTNWTSPQVRAMIASYQAGGDGHQH